MPRGASPSSATPSHRAVRQSRSVLSRIAACVLRLATGGLIVGAAGRLSPEKGFDQYVDAAAFVCRQRSDVGFVLFGDGPLRGDWRHRSRRAGCRRGSSWRAFAPTWSDFCRYLDLAVLSSHTEGLPVVVLEAMAARLPVVATAVGGTPEVIDDGVTGHLVAPGDVAALARRIGEVLADDAERRRMGERGRRRIEEHFTFAAQSRAYQALFEQLTRGSMWLRNDEKTARLSLTRAGTSGK